jgi:hypothetical protein
MNKPALHIPPFRLRPEAALDECPVYVPLRLRKRFTPLPQEFQQEERLSTPRYATNPGIDRSLQQATW